MPSNSACRKSLKVIESIDFFAFILTHWYHNEFPPKNKMKFCRSVKFLAFRISNVIAFKSPKKSWKRGNRTKADTQSGKQNNFPKQQKKHNGKKCAKNRNKYLTECIFAFFFILKSNWTCRRNKRFLLYPWVLSYFHILLFAFTLCDAL